MMHRLAAYVLIVLVVALSVAGLGWWPAPVHPVGSLTEQALAAPLGGASADNNGGTDNGDEDNGDLDNGAEDNGAEDNGAEDNGDEDNGDEDNGDEDNGDEDNGDGDGNDNTQVIELETTVTVTAAAPPPPPAAPPPPPSFGGPGNCQYVLGFADLHRALNGRPGACLENEHPDPNGSGDQIQATAFPPPNGLMVWNARTNTMRWTDGYKTWTYSKCLLQERLNTQTWRWEQDPSLMLGPDPNPPPGACSLV